MPYSPTQPFSRAGSACPTCSAPAEEGQLVCLECGSRVALDYRRPPSWRVPVAIIAAVVLVVAAVAAIALKAIGDDAEREAASIPIDVDSAAEGATEKRAEARAPAAASDELAKQGALYSWPGELEGFTVVLLSTEDRGGAERFARSASEGRPAKIGVIRADDFKSLEKGFFVVFAGRYQNRELADRAANRLGRRFRGAFPQLVER